MSVLAILLLALGVFLLYLVAKGSFSNVWTAITHE